MIKSLLHASNADTRSRLFEIPSDFARVKYRKSWEIRIKLEETTTEVYVIPTSYKKKTLLEFSVFVYIEDLFLLKPIYTIDWDYFEKEFSGLSPEKGRPAHLFV